VKHRSARRPQTGGPANLSIKNGLLAVDIIEGLQKAVDEISLI
jgi:hypothetical protein